MEAASKLVKTESARHLRRLAVASHVRGGCLSSQRLELWLVEEEHWAPSRAAALAAAYEDCLGVLATYDEYMARSVFLCAEDDFA
jgi:hypothetical protein